VRAINASTSSTPAAACTPERLWIAVVMVSVNGIFVVGAQPELQPVASQEEAAALTLDLINVVTDELPHGVCLYAVYLRRDVPRADLLHHIVTNPHGTGLINHPDTVGLLLPGLGGNLTHFGWWSRDEAYSDEADYLDAAEADADEDEDEGYSELFDGTGLALLSGSIEEGEELEEEYVFVGEA
jgi:hypothetical protein